MTTRRAFMQLLGIAGIAPKAVTQPLVQTLSPAGETLLAAAKISVEANEKFNRVNSWLDDAPSNVREVLEYIRMNRTAGWKDPDKRESELREFKSMSKAAARAIAKAEHEEFIKKVEVMNSLEYWIMEQFNPEVKKLKGDFDYVFAGTGGATCNPAPPAPRSR